MKHHNLYRLALTGYWGGGFLFTLAFLLIIIAILTGNDAAEGLGALFSITGGAGLIAGGISHAFAVDMKGELKPLSREQRASIERQARERRADRELNRALEEEERRTRAIEGRPVVCEREDHPGWCEGDVNLIAGEFLCRRHR